MRKQRVISAAVLLAVLAVTVVLGGYFFGALVLLFASVGALEFNRAMRVKGMHPMYAVTGMFVLILLLQIVFRKPDCFSLNFGEGVFGRINWFAVLSLGAVMLSLILAVFKGGKYTPTDAAISLFGGFYAVIMASFFFSVRELGQGYDGLWCFLIAFLPDIGADTAAYEIGSRIGKHPLIPKVSPKKSVEGSIAAFGGSVLTALVLGIIFTLSGAFTAVPLWAYPVIGLFTGLVSQVGDLAASSIKRYAGIKDFGKIIPGHGGVLDRIDSLLFVFPMVFCVLSLLV